ncbi:MAG: glycoside hydrolase family 172 protein [Armatimonadota bacterium]
MVTVSIVTILSIMLLGCAVVSDAAVKAQTKGSTDMSPLYRMPDEHVETRWFTFENVKGEKGAAGKANFGRKGAPFAWVRRGETLVVADIKEGGTIRRIWSAGLLMEPNQLRGMKLEIFWDGAKTPAVQVPYGDFFFHSMGHMATFESALFSSPEGRSFNCVVPMPFKKSARIQITNESDKDVAICYEVDVTLGDKHDDKMLYFHSYWRRENMTALRQDMTILPKLEGEGRFLGCNIGTRLHPSMTNFWWGEGEVKVYLDGDKDLPTFSGTGTEDYIGSGYGQELFSNQYQGNQLVIKTKEEPHNPIAYGYYRLHVPDPVYFYKDIRVTIQVMGGATYQQLLDALAKDPSLKFMKAGDGTQYYTREELEAVPDRAEAMERIDDVCATAYWYMDKPGSKLPPIAPYSERIEDLP